MSNLKLVWTSKGKNGSGTLTAMLDEKPVHVDTGNLAKARFRQDFAAKITSLYPAIMRSEVNGELTRLAAEGVHRESDEKGTGDPQCEDFKIVRPERLILPEVSGLSCPAATILDGKPAGKWMLYLQWADGRRESLELPEYLTLPDRQRLWIHPTPSLPAADTVSGWSMSSRQQWLSGSKSPEPADLFKRLCERAAYFIDLPAEQAPGILSTLNLWVMMTYCYPVWSAIPYLYIGGPLGSGKSRVFEILERMAFRPISSASLTSSVMFRMLNDRGGTLLLDEAERLKSDAPEVKDLLSMLLSGYKRGGKAYRNEKINDNFRAVSFDVFGPKVLGCIAGLPPALSSRCIPLMMFRAGPDSVKPRRRIDTDPAGWQRLRNDLHMLALEYGRVWLELPERQDVCPEMTGRNYELWQPLLSMAQWLTECGAEGLFNLVVDYAMETIENAKEDQTPDADEILLRLAASRVQMGQAFTPGELLVLAQNEEPTVFARWSGKGVANVLRRYGLVTQKSNGRKVYRGLSISDMLKIQTHYSIDLNLSIEDNFPSYSSQDVPQVPYVP